MENNILKYLVVFLMFSSLISCQSNKQILDRLEMIQGQLYAKEINTISRIDFNSSQNVLIDVRDVNDYNAGHISKALNMDLNSEDFAQKVVKLSAKKTYYIYGKSKTQAQMGRDAFKLAGLSKVFSFENGIDEYKGGLIQGFEELEPDFDDEIEDQTDAEEDMMNGIEIL